MCLGVIGTLCASVSGSICLLMCDWCVSIVCVCACVCVYCVIAVCVEMMISKPMRDDGDDVCHHLLLRIRVLTEERERREKRRVKTKLHPHIYTRS